MPFVSENRLKGNYGAAVVMARLSSECLVRPVAVDTDVGVDLYCESVEEGTPFLHFWLQVKAGEQCRLAADETSASCSFATDHLLYWYRQPVPVFAALVPTPWPPTVEPRIYVIDMTTRLLLEGIPQGQRTRTLNSDYVWEPGSRESVREFINRIVPDTAARLQCSRGIVAARPTPVPEYVQTSPAVPVARYHREILNQIRRTAANSIIFLYYLSQFNGDTADFRRILAGVVAQFRDDQHWENFMSRAISYHADETYDDAVRLYQEAIDCIQSDSNVCSLPEWQDRISEIRELQHRASSQIPINHQAG